MLRHTAGSAGRIWPKGSMRKLGQVCTWRALFRTIRDPTFFLSGFMPNQDEQGKFARFLKQQDSWLIRASILRPRPPSFMPLWVRKMNLCLV